MAFLVTISVTLTLSASLYFFLKYCGWLSPVSGVPVLMYHKVSKGNSDKLTVTIDQLNDQFAHIRASGYVPISLTTLADIVDRRIEPPKNPLLITFDDGYAETYELILPLLKKHDLYAILFIPTSFVGKTNAWDGGDDRVMDFDTIRDAPDEFVEFGLHSHGHKDFNTLSAPQVEKDLSTCIRKLAEEKCKFFPALAYPFGALPADKRNRRRVKTVMAALGIKFGFRIGSRINRFPIRDYYEIKRIGINGTDSFREFQIKLKNGRLRPF